MTNFFKIVQRLLSNATFHPRSRVVLKDSKGILFISIDSIIDHSIAVEILAIPFNSEDLISITDGIMVAVYCGGVWIDCSAFQEGRLQLTGLLMYSPHTFRVFPRGTNRDDIPLSLNPVPYELLT